VGSERSHRERLDPEVQDRLRPEPSVLRPPERNPIVTREDLARDPRRSASPTDPRATRGPASGSRGLRRSRRPRSRAAGRVGGRDRARRVATGRASCRDRTRHATSARKLPVTTIGIAPRQRPEQVSPCATRERSCEEHRDGRSCERAAIVSSFIDIFFAMRSSGSSNVPRRSITPHAATRMKRVPSGIAHWFLPVLRHEQERGGRRRRGSR